MKKLFLALLFAGAAALSACGEASVSASSTESKLKNNGYEVTVSNLETAKVKYQGFNYENVNFSSAVMATKGEGKDQDFFLGFFFGSISEAENFIYKNNNENLGAMNSLVQNSLGENLQARVGTHNNVAYVASTVSFAAAFN